VSNRFIRALPVGMGLVVAAFAVVPAAAEAAPVNLATVTPFVVLGGQTVTNTGPSVLNGELGVSPGAALPGFGLPAVVNGATHANDAVAAQAQLDLTTAYDVAAGQAETADLTATDLGNRTLTTGAYRYTGDALLTGPLTLDAQGDPNAQFVFMIAGQLTTASASSVLLINGASPCNVFWQVGSSATLGSTTAFQGNLMALTSVSLDNAVTVQGRVLARNGQVSLINDVLTAPDCATDTTTGAGTPTAAGAPATGPIAPGTVAVSPAASRAPANRPVSAAATRNGRATLRQTSIRRGTLLPRTTPTGPCTDGFRASIRGRMIRRVVFSLDGRRIASRTTSPFRVIVRSLPGVHKVTARVTFKDATRARTLSLGYRTCAVAVRRPATAPPQFTG
jgi:ice-binding like protein